MLSERCVHAQTSLRAWLLRLLWVAWLCAAAACTGPGTTATQAGTATATAATQELRITNDGDQELTGLVVLFPGPTADAPARRVSFGDVPAGQTSEYREVPGGVYRYAAYEYTLDGQLVQQAVVDWVGESPMEGTRFTYRLRLDPQQPKGGQIDLEEVVVDAR